MRETPIRRWAAGLKTGADYAKGLWLRLNGRGQPLDANNLLRGLPGGISLPEPNREARLAAVKALSVDIDTLEKKLQEASKVQQSFVESEIT